MWKSVCEELLCRCNCTRKAQFMCRGGRAKRKVGKNVGKMPLQNGERVEDLLTFAAPRGRLIRDRGGIQLSASRPDRSCEKRVRENERPSLTINLGVCKILASPNLSPLQSRLGLLEIACFRGFLVLWVVSLLAGMFLFCLR